MEVEHKIKTPEKKYFTAFVCSMVVLALSVFLTFGYLLREYLKYAVDKQKASEEVLIIKKNHEDLKGYLRQQEGDYKIKLSELKKAIEQLDEKIAEREAKIKTQQSIIDEITQLSNQIRTAQANLKTIQSDLETAKGSHATLLTTNVDIQKKNDSIQKEYEAKTTEHSKNINLLNQVKEDKEKDIEKLSAQKKILDSQIQSVNDNILTLKQEVDRLQIQLNDEKLKVSNVTAELTSVTNRNQQEATRLSKLRSDQNDLQIFLTNKNLEKDALSKEIVTLQKKKTDLEIEIEKISDKNKSVTQQK